jgi:predicted phosphoribosyltransferase
MFESISRKFQLKFKDRAAAGNILAEILEDRLKKEKSHECIFVVGVPRGGMVTADSVIRKLSISTSSSSSPSSKWVNTSAVYFGIVIPRKLTDPNNKEQAIRAVMEDGTTYLNQERINMLQITQEYLQKEKAKQIAEIRYRTVLYSTNLPINNYHQRHHHHENIKDKVIILVDDGAATGATLMVAARWLRKKHSPKRLIIAVPVAQKDTVKLLKQEADLVEVMTAPPLSNFVSVGQFYQNFEPILHDKVIEIMRRNWSVLY